MNSLQRVFICFAAEDRYSIAEPIAYHLKNYGIEIWYDRYALLLGDNRINKNLDEGVAQCRYAVAILSQFTEQSICAMEELSIIKERKSNNEVTVFPILYELSPNKIPFKLQWIKDLIFKEADKNSGTREICNHIACKITSDILKNTKYQNIQDIINQNPILLPSATKEILRHYRKIDYSNLNSRVTMLYAAYLTIIHSSQIKINSLTIMISRIFERLFSETGLNLSIDYRELWLLENSISILIDSYLASCTESKI